MHVVHDPRLVHSSEIYSAKIRFTYGQFPLAFGFTSVADVMTLHLAGFRAKKSSSFDLKHLKSRPSNSR